MMPKVLSVGQCGFDHSSIARQLRTALGASVEAASSQTEALAALRGGGYDLVLVNRVFDDDGAPGLDLIRALKADSALADLPVILVSNYADAQAEAEELGALPGFGKAELTTAEARQRLEAALSRPRED